MINLFKKCIYYTFLLFTFFTNKIVAIIYFERKKRFVGRFNSFGKGSQISLEAEITNPHLISIGDDFSAKDKLRIDAISFYKGFLYTPQIIIGNNVCFNSDCHIGAIDKVSIGNNVLLASRVFISDHFHGEISKEALSKIPLLRNLSSKGPIIIEDNVWIGEGVCIFSNVVIGKNAIIGANSVVTKNIPANAVAAGIPAKVLKILN